MDFHLSAIFVSTDVASLPSPLRGHHFVFEIDTELDHHSDAHHRERRRSGRGEALDTWDCDNVTVVPNDIRTSFPLNEFYQKYMHAYGIPILSSNISQDVSLMRACYVVRFLLADRKDLRDAMYDRYGRVAVIAKTERTTQIPEHSYLNSNLWDSRARGLGGFPQVPVTTNAEENLLCEDIASDPWFEEDVLVHEFAHAIHLISLDRADPSFDARLQTIYNMAKAENLWRDTYAIVKRTEYFAEGVQGFFNVQTCSSFVDGVHNHVCTREALRGYDSRLYNLITEVFPCMNTIVDRCNSTQSLAANQELRMNCEIVTTTTTTAEGPTTTPTDLTTTAATTVLTTSVASTTTPHTTTDSGATENFTGSVSVTTQLSSTSHATTAPDKFCEEGTTFDIDAGVLTWPVTAAGTRSQSIEVCALETQKAGSPIALRNCSTVVGSLLHPEWEEQWEIQDCGTSKDRNDISVKDLTNVTVSTGNAVEVAQFLANLTGNFKRARVRPILGDVSEVFQNIIAAESGDAKVTEAMSKTVDDVVIGLSSGQLKGGDDPKSRSIIVESFQAQVARTLRQAGNVSLRQESVQVEAVSISRSEAVMSGLSFASVRPGGTGGASATEKVPLNETRIQTFLGQNGSANGVVSVQLPGSELDQAHDGGNSGQLRASFIVYGDDTLFPSARTAGTQNAGPTVGGFVIAVTLQDLVLRDLANPAVIQFKAPSNGDTKTMKQTRCVFWDFTLRNGTGDWSEEGCALNEATNDVIECHCDHLTNFAILIEEVIGSSQALHVSSQIGCALCIAFLAITLLASLCLDNSKGSQKGSTSRLLFYQLCVSLLVLYVVFLAGVDGAKGSNGGCMFVAAFLHYLVLVVTVMMVIYAVDLYLATSKKIPRDNAPKFHTTYAVLVACGFPMIVIAITVPSAMEYYKINSDVMNSGPTYCFLKPGLAMYLGLLLPVCIFLALNATVFLLVWRRLPRADKRLHSAQTSQRLQEAVGISLLTFLTWLFGILAITSAAIAYDIVFLIASTLQGLFVFIMFCIRRKEVRAAISTHLRCSCLKGSNQKQKYELGQKNVQLDTKLSM
ncbi:adhesion G-protein coupled receptor G7-like isoform X2 [Acanthaster planci]|uniref:Adhesion G-protein coupled receptor G7-like isoform X2 n=1 Tax=Acanthaster planci TaxID=133434 RepID=A0A8B7ZQA3_ACAPL|nr:adhesion G-protein coupled receptor G7-like isoform X2 [Acanthaster planci]